MRKLMMACFLLLPLAAAAEEAGKPGTITVRGEANVKVAPDEALIPVTLTAENETLAAAKEESDGKLAKLLDIAQQHGVAREDVQSQNSGVQPKYDYGQNTTTQTDIFTGNIGFSFDMTGFAQDKVDALTLILEKAGLSGINTSHRLDKIRVSGTFNDRNPDAKALHEELRKKEDDILKASQAAGIDNDKIIHNTYENAGKETHAAPARQHISGYKSTVTVALLVKHKDQVVPLINALVKSGVDTIGNVSFMLSANGAKTAKETLSLAALKDAEAKARKLAQASGATLGRPITINEGVSNVQEPFSRFSAGMLSDAVQSPAAPELPAGQVEIEQSVTVTYALK